MDGPSAERYLELWGKALPEDAPCGEDCAFSSEFERLRVEVDKDASLHGLEATDWKLVAQIAASILTTQSKDMWALVYAVYAEYRLHGFAACPPAFTALAQMLERWWDSLYPSPKRLKRRLAPLIWLCGRMEHQAQITCFMDGSSEAVQELRDVFARMQELLREKAGDDIPSFPGVFAKISEANQPPPRGPDARGNPANPNPQSRAGQAESAPPAWDKTGTELSGRIPVGTLPPLIRGIIDQTRQLAEHFLALNPKDARAYRLHRLGMWDTLLQAPAADADGKTQIGSGVPPDRIKSYAAAVEAGQYADILPYLERAAGKSPFWFEGHAWVYRCLEGVGASEAATSVKEALGSLLRRFPELLTYKFRENIPFAPPAALPWLESLRLPGGADKGGKDIARAQVGAEDAQGVDLLQAALVKGKEEGFEAGLRLLGSAPATRSRPAVLHGLAQARYCLLAGKSAVAAQLLSALYERMEQWNMLDWEPELTADILSLLLHSQARQNDARTQELLRRLHWLNLDAALDLSLET